MVRAQIAAAVSLVASAASGHVLSMPSASDSFAPSETVTPTAETNATMPDGSALSATDNRLEARCYTYTHTRTVYESTATATSYATGVKRRSEATAVDPAASAGQSFQALHQQDDKDAPGNGHLENLSAENDNNPLAARHMCHVDTTITATAPVTTAYEVIETEVQPGDTVTGKPTITRDGQAYAPITTVSVGAAPLLRPGLW